MRILIFGVNFRILGENRDDWAKIKYTKLKRES